MRPDLDAGHAAAQLEAVFRDIAAQRMQGLPIVNPALDVEAVGFRAWQACQLGVLVTPWTLGLVLLAGAEGALEELPLGQQRDWQFPSGSYAFMGLQDARLGTCQICPLISPMHEFSCQAEAREVAREVLHALFAPVAAPPPPPSRRAFLRAALPGA
ncbi:MAG: [NiFe]-hydrogenase assembly chaperone HybE [Pseudomonadota bacterium]|nr:[NiFe]-hydrogenase assembly chaperone HybE [Pseudomonadota bacterium]